MANESSDSKVDRSRKRLYSRNQPDVQHSDSSLSPSKDSGVRRRFTHDNNGSDSGDGGSGNKDKFLNKLLIFSGIFFVLAAGFALFSIGLGGDSVSPDNIDVSVSGPVTARAGEVASLDIAVRNDNPVTLQNAVLSITYPPGTRQTENTGERLRRFREDIGQLQPQETSNVNVEAVLFGEQGETKEINIQLEYEVADSNAVFSADRVYNIEIAESPVALSVDSPTDVTVGQPFTFNVTVQSNTSRRLENVIATVNYPFGFQPTSVSPEASFRQRVWSLSDLDPGDEHTIEITGVLSGSGLNEQSFQFETGLASAGDETTIGTLFASQTQTLAVTQPFINLSLELTDDDSSETITAGASEVEGVINWQSNLDTTVSGAEFTADFFGDAIDFGSLGSNDGFYRSADRQIVWDSRTNSELSRVEPGDNGELRFDFETKRPEVLAGQVENPTIRVETMIEAETPQNSSLPNPITADISREIRLSSHVTLLAETLHADGPFTNDGPVPPEAEETTSYTLHLEVTNTTNTLERARLQAVLPPYVELAGDPEPSSAQVSYNETSGQLVWEIGSIAPGAGFTAPPVEVFVPVEVTPSESQIGDVPPLLENTVLTATDSFIDTELSVNPNNTPTTELAEESTDDNSGTVQD